MEVLYREDYRDGKLVKSNKTIFCKNPELVYSDKKCWGNDETKIFRCEIPEEERQYLLLMPKKINIYNDCNLTTTLKAIGYLVDGLFEIVYKDEEGYLELDFSFNIDKLNLNSEELSTLTSIKDYNYCSRYNDLIKIKSLSLRNGILDGKFLFFKENRHKNYVNAKNALLSTPEMRLIINKRGITNKNEIKSSILATKTAEQITIDKTKKARKEFEAIFRERKTKITKNVEKILRTNPDDLSDEILSALSIIENYET